MMLFAPALRKFTFTAHVTSSVGWLGAVLVCLGLVRHPSPMIHAILALVLLVIATGLGVYKPFGVTPYGSRKQVERRPAVGAGSVRSITSTGTAPWPYIAALIAILALVLVLLHFAGDHVRH